MQQQIEILQPAHYLLGCHGTINISNDTILVKVSQYQVVSRRCAISADIVVYLNIYYVNIYLWLRLKNIYLLF